MDALVARVRVNGGAGSPDRVSQWPVDAGGNAATRAPIILLGDAPKRLVDVCEHRDKNNGGLLTTHDVNQFSHHYKGVVENHRDLDGCRNVHNA